MRMKRHVMIYHHGPRLYHFAPAIVYYLLQNKQIREYRHRMTELFMKRRKTSSVDMKVSAK